MRNVIVVTVVWPIDFIRFSPDVFSFSSFPVDFNEVLATTKKHCSSSTHHVKTDFATSTCTDMASLRSLTDSIIDQRKRVFYHNASRVWVSTQTQERPSIDLFISR